MSLFILTETSAGYALFKAKDKKLLKRDGFAEEAATAEGACSLLKLKQFQKFDSAATALNEAAALTEGKITPMLSSLLDSIKDEKKASLAVADPKLGSAINKLPHLSITPISDSTTIDLYRAIRTHLSSLVPGLMPDDVSTMSLGLSHSLSRHKLKFSPDKVDTMIVQAIHLLDDLDKELNIYAMRVREWYGWHFPEMARIINDNLAYARVVLAMGMRTDAREADLAEILPEEIDQAVKAAAELSMGSEIAAEDLANIRALAEQVVSFSEYRTQLGSYLGARMQAVAPNLTALVGELVGARLIAHAGSLLSLAKSPASTIQILGAEKALFKALKTKHDTPKYGLLFHASLVGQASGKHKGKIARMLAGKAALSLRVDALSDWGVSGVGVTAANEPSQAQKAALGNESRVRVERRLRGLEGRPLGPKGVEIGPDGAPKGKWEVKEARKYNRDADGLYGDEPAARSKGKASPLLAMEYEPSTKPKLAGPGKGANGAEESDHDEDEDESDEKMEDAKPGLDVKPASEPAASSITLNGSASDKHSVKATHDEEEDSDDQDEKRRRKEEKLARKLEKAEKKAAKEEKRAAKEEKRAAKAAKMAKEAKKAEKEARRVEKEAKLAEKEGKLAEKEPKRAEKEGKRAEKEGKRAEKEGKQMEKEGKRIEKAAKEVTKEEKKKKRKRDAEAEEDIAVADKKEKKKKKSKL